MKAIPSQLHNTMEKIKLQYAALIVIILLAAFSRLYSPMFNFSPLAAIGLFGAAHFADKKWAFLVPLLATWLSDLFINNVVYAEFNQQFVWFYSGFYWQYGSYLLITALGLLLYKKKISVVNMLVGAVLASIVFYLITNFGSWLSGAMYPADFSGLMMSYTAGIPFFKGTLLGNLFYTVVLFGGYYLLQKQFSVFRLKHVQYA